MKKLLLGFCLLAFLAVSSTSCSPKVGCEINETTHTDMSKAKRGNSNLFPKDMRRKRN